MPSLLPGAPQLDPGSHFHLGTRKIHLVPGYVCLSDDYWSLLLEMRPRVPLCKAGRERGSRVSLLEARKSFHLWFCHSLPEQGKSVSGSLVHQESFLQAISIPCLSRLLTMDLTFIFVSYFIFSFLFLFLEQLGLGVISHAVTSVTNWWRSHKTDHDTWENEVEGTRIKWRHTAWTTYAGLMQYSWLFRVGCTVVSMDHGL